MKIDILRSGSAGNCTLFEDEDTLILIDMGVTLKTLKEGLEGIGKKLIDLDAMLLTHEHIDHTKGIRYLNPLPIYATKGTLDLPNVIEILPCKSFKIKNIKITPVSLSHDANNPVGFVLENNKNEKCVYITDTGFIPDLSDQYLYNADYYIFESNYDYRMLLETNRPPRLIQRISSDLGHLANEDSANYLCDYIGDNTKEIALAHLSREANSHEKALETHMKIYKKRHVDISKINVICASQFYSVSIGKNE